MCVFFYSFIEKNVPMSFLDNLKEKAENAKQHLIAANKDYVQRDESYSSKNANPKLSGVFASLFFGLLTLLIGVGLFYATQNDIGEFYAPKWIIYVCAAIFGFTGMFMLLFPTKNFLKHKKQVKNNVNHLATWQKDYTWSAENILQENPTKKIKNHVLVSIILLPFIAIMSYFAFSDGGILLALLTLLFVVVEFFVLKELIKDLQKYVKYGISELVLSQMPLYVGEKTNVKFRNENVCRDFAAINTHLLLIQEVVLITTNSSGGRERTIKFKCLHKSTKRHTTNSSFCDIEIDIPADLPANEISAEESRYWVLDIEGHHSTKTFKTTFLLPVYCQ